MSEKTLALYTIPPFIYAGLHSWHKEQFTTRRTGFTSDEYRIIYLVAKQFDISPQAILGKLRLRKIANARQIAMHFCRKYTNSSLSKIGEIFDRDHTTVIYSIGVVKDLYEYDMKYRVSVDAIEVAIIS